jgi:REP element-mobilizing transposase RayT
MKLPVRKRIRMDGFDYSKDNLYFITSCVKNMNCCFGHVVRTGRDLSVQHADQNLIPSENKMILNEWGKIAESQWLWLAVQYSYVVLHEFVIMPNHMHGILEIKRANIVVQTGRDLSVQQPPDKIKSLSELMGAYKTTTSSKIHLLENAKSTDGSRPVSIFAWHRSFHDRIIRNESEYRRISEYIRNNPLKWSEDKYFNPDHYHV